MKKALLLLGLLSLPAFGQGVPYFSNVFTSSNSAPPGSMTPMLTLPFAKVTICGASPVGNPCTNTVVIYANASMSVTAHNPITADVHGRFNFWAPAGTYSYSVQSAGGTLLGTYYVTLGGSGGGSSVAFQHNGTTAPNQNVVNFNDSTPAAPTGNVNVTFQTDSTGKWSAYVPIQSSNFTLTTTGTTGPSSYSGGVLNVPDYTYTLTVPKITALGTLTNDTTGNAAKVGGVAISGTPGVGQVPVATSGTTATWQNVSSGGGGGLTGQTTNCVPKANSATTSSSSAALCDSGTALTASEPVTVNDGTGAAGIVAIKQGTAQSTVTSSIGITAPTSVTAYNVKLPSAQGTGALTNDGAGNLSWNPAGGAALPAATAPGQFITSTGAGTAYAPQAQIFYSQSGDTLTSIEAECSSLCTYVVTVPQTFTLTANHTLSANVQLAFTADGKWTVNGAFTLTIPSPQVTGPLTTHFDGTATLSFTTLTELPFEWLGAVGDGTTDNLAAMQKCLDSLVVGQCLAQAKQYNFNGTLSITRSQIGIRGTDPVSTVLLSTASATSDVLYVHGTGTGAGVINWNLFSNFLLQKSVAGTGTSTCMKVDHVNNAKIKLVNASNCAIVFYMHDAGADYFDTTYAAPAAGTSNSAYWMDSTDGAGEQSVVLKDTTANCSTGNKGYNISGAAINDIDLYAPAAGNCNYDLWVNYTGTGATDSQSDIHIIAPTFDSAQTSAVYISGITYSGQVASALVLEGGYLQCGSGTCKTLDIESSIGVVIANTQIGNFDTVNPTVEVNGSKSISLIGNSLMDVQANGIQFDSTSNSTITGNVIHGAGGTGHTLISLNSGSYNTVAGNTLNGAATNGIYSGDATNTCGANGVDPTSITSPYVGTCTGAKLGSTTVAGLPTATSVGAGAMYLVTDATATTGGTCTGGGTAKAIAVSDGSGYTCTPSGGTGGNIGLYAPLIGAAVPTAASTGFSTGVNQQGSFSITNTAMGLSMVDTAGHSGEWIEGAVKAYPGTTYTINGLFMTGAGAPIGGPANYHLAGFVIMNTTTSQLMFFGWRWAGGSCGTGSSNWQVTVMAYNSPTAFNATLSSPNYQCVLNPSTALTWLKLRDDGTNITFSMSLDGVTYQQVYTVAKSSSFLGSSGFNYIGMVIDPSTSVADGATLIGYGLTTP